MNLQHGRFGHGFDRTLLDLQQRSAADWDQYPTRLHELQNTHKPDRYLGSTSIQNPTALRSKSKMRFSETRLSMVIRRARRRGVSHPLSECKPNSPAAGKCFSENSASQVVAGGNRTRPRLGRGAGIGGGRAGPPACTANGPVRTKHGFEKSFL